MAAALGLVFMMACSPNMKGVKPPEQFEKDVRELVRLQEDREAVDKKLAAMKKDIPEKERQIPPLEQSIAELKSKLDVLEKMDATAYAQVTQLTGGKDQQTALKAVRGFLRDYPTSKLADEAKKLEESLAATINQQMEQKRLADEQEKARLAAQKKDTEERFERRELSISELKTFLQGRDQDQIVALLGPPSQGNNLNWIYEGEYVTDEAGRRRGIVIYFTGGRVSSVGFR